MEKRNEKIDFIKSLAILFVIFIHILSEELVDFTINKDFFVSLFYRSAVSPAVPLFFMCSGVLLFNKQKQIGIREIKKKYLPKILIPLFFWATIYELVQIYYRYQEIGVLEKTSLSLALRNILFFHHNYHLYYLYMMIIFYLFTPIVKELLNHISQQYIKYLLFIWLSFGILLPSFTSFTPLSPTFTKYIYMPMGYASVGYGLLGYYISNYSRERRPYLSLYILSLFIAFYLSFKLSIGESSINPKFLGGMSITVAMMAYGIFAFVFSTDYKVYYSKVSKKIAEASFGIYLIHDLFLKLFDSIGLSFSFLPVYINVPIKCFLILAISYLACRILSKIKIVNKYLI